MDERKYLRSAVPFALRSMRTDSGFEVWYEEPADRIRVIVQAERIGVVGIGLAILYSLLALLTGSAAGAGQGLVAAGVGACAWWGIRSVRLRSLECDAVVVDEQAEMVRVVRVDLRSRSVRETIAEAACNDCEIVESPLRVKLRYGIPVWKGYIAHLRVADAEMVIGVNRPKELLEQSYSRISKCLSVVRRRTGQKISLFGNVRLGDADRVAPTP